jgi:hypothetical protein
LRGQMLQLARQRFVGLYQLRELPSLAPHHDDQHRRPHGFPSAIWVLVLSRLVMNDSRLPIEASVMTMIAHGRHLRYQLTV